MLKWFRRQQHHLAITPPHTKDPKDIPGKLGPSVDDLRFEAIDFEKQVRSYIERHTGKWPTGQLGQLIHDVLPRVPKYPEFPEIWSKFLIEAKELKELRNGIVHSDLNNLPPLSELYQRFKKANNLLRPFEVCSVPRDRFSNIHWSDDVLHFEIDVISYALDEQDLENLLSELHPASRGKVHFAAGKLIGSKMLDYKNERWTYYIEDYEPFELTEQESMALQDLLMCFLGNPTLRYN